MAVRIITPGITSAEIKYETTCSNCRCRFEFTGADGKLVHDQRDGSYITIPCPTCGKSASVQARSPADEMRRRQNSRVDPY